MFKTQLRCAWLCLEIANPLVNNKVCLSVNGILFWSYSLVFMGFIQLPVGGFHSEIMPETIMVSLFAFQTCVCVSAEVRCVSLEEIDEVIVVQKQHWRTLGAFGCFIMMSLCCIAASEWATLYSEAELILQTLPLFFALLFSLSLFLSWSKSPLYSCFLCFFLPLATKFHKIPPLFLFHFHFSSSPLRLCLPPLSAGSTAAEQINELAPTEPDTGRWHCKDMLYVTQQ